MKTDSSVSTTRIRCLQWTGEIGAMNASTVEAATTSEMKIFGDQDGIELIEIDIGGVTYIHTAGVRMMERVMKFGRKLHIQVMWVNIPPIVSETAHDHGLDQLLFCGGH